MSNARIALGSERRGWQVAFRVSNLFGAKYWTEYYPNVFPAPPYPCNNCSSAGAVGAPRQYFVSLNYKY